MKLWVISDTHFGHGNILRFKRDSGSLLRPGFLNIDEHDKFIIDNWNAVVSPQDHVYHLGDFSMSRHIMKRIAPLLLGHKRLVRGNHDLGKTKEYIDAGFKEIYGVRVFENHGLILSHIPIHPGSLKPGWRNIHGHLHDRSLDDDRYVCVSVEHTGYAPVELLRLSDPNFVIGTRLR